MSSVSPARLATGTGSAPARRWCLPNTRASGSARRSRLRGSLYVGSPETVARRIATAVTDLGVGRFDLIYTTGSQPIGARLRAVELYGTKVVPMVRQLVAA
jgi:alkanesulfonate monooxygenase SsuD/methylene tetrahydromethanopterin reductase-like flavin-dependent oxidoreductase (luciferase family)